MGYHSAPTPQMRQAAGPPRRSVPYAVTLPPAASRRAGSVTAMPTAWTTVMSRAVVRPLDWVGQKLLGVACPIGGCTRFPEVPGAGTAQGDLLSSWRGYTLLSAMSVLVGTVPLLSPGPAHSTEGVWPGRILLPQRAVRGPGPAL